MAYGLPGAANAGTKPEAPLESLELAELAAALQDEVGSDPFSEGEFPDTVAELIAFYAG